METNQTDVKASDNANGYYCGACHNGKMVYNGNKVFEVCMPRFTSTEGKPYKRCHSYGKNVVPENDFVQVTARFPKERFGNRINREKAEGDGLIKRVYFLEGFSIKRKTLNMHVGRLRSKVEVRRDA